MTERRPLVIYNEHSSRAREVQHEVLDNLASEAIAYKSFATPSPHFDENVEAIAEKLRAGDRLMVASGDGVASQAANAVLMSGLPDLDIAFLNYGGFNDLARSFGTANIEPALLAAGRMPIWPVVPLDIEADGTPIRRGIGYATFGYAAEMSDDFMNTAERERIKRYGKHAAMAMSLLRLGSEYLRQRHDIVLPPLIANGRYLEEVSDIVAVSGRMASLKHPDWQRPDVFSLDFRHGANPIDYAQFVLGSLMRGIKGESVGEVKIEFSYPATFMGQTEGEAFGLSDISSLSVSKQPLHEAAEKGDFVPVVMPRAA